MMATNRNNALTAKTITMVFGSHYPDIAFKCLFTLIGLLVNCSVIGQADNIESPPDRLITVSYGAGKVYFSFKKDLLQKPLLMTKNSTEYYQVMLVPYGNTISLETRPIASLSGIVIPIDNDPQLERKRLGEFPKLSKSLHNGCISVDVTSLFPNGSTDSMEVRYFKNETMLSIANGNVRDHFSFYLLPEPMRPRRFDYRMGFFMEDAWSEFNHYAKKVKGSISRWRLHKVEGGKELAEPENPIVFYLHPDIPIQVQTYIKSGILEWSKAFEAAGFKNALVVKDAPSNYDEMMLHSINSSFVVWKDDSKVRMRPSKANSTAMKVVDFRSGEIMKATIVIGAAYEFWTDDYFTRCSPLDDRALKRTLPEELYGAIIQALVAHETGHALGLKDGNYGEYTYPLDSIRKISWLRSMGHTPSVMNYTRAHHIAQPEDSIPPALLHQKVGPADRYSIEWGYAQMEEGQDEVAFLDGMIRMQDTIPWLRFIGGEYERLGPQYSNEVADNDSPIQSAVLGTENLRRVLELIPMATWKDEDNTRSERLYNLSLQLWKDQMLNVVNLVGGYDIHHKAPSQKGNAYNPIPLERQMEALEYLLSNVFKRPNWLASPKFSSSFRYSASSDKMLSHQLAVMKELLNAMRFKRMENIEPGHVHQDLTFKMVSELQNGIWEELNDKSIKIDPYRQELQNAYITFMTEAILKEKNYASELPTDKYYEYTDYSKSVIMFQLIRLSHNIDKSLKDTKDKEVYGHLMLCKKKIDQLL